MLAIQARQVRGVAKVVRERLHRGSGRPGQILILLKLWPARENFSSFFDADAIADVVAQDDVEAREKNLQEEVREPTEMRHRRRHHHLVIDVSINHELVGRIGLVELNGIQGPWWKLRPLGLPGGRSLGKAHQACSFWAWDL